MWKLFLVLFFILLQSCGGEGGGSSSNVRERQRPRNDSQETNYFFLIESSAILFNTERDSRYRFSYITRLDENGVRISSLESAKLNGETLSTTPNGEIEFLFLEEDVLDELEQAHGLERVGRYRSELEANMDEYIVIQLRKARIPMGQHRLELELKLSNGQKISIERSLRFFSNVQF